MAQEELARRAEDMLVELKQAATRAAASWRVKAPSVQQKEVLDRQLGRTMRHAKQAFPAAAVGLPLDQVPAEQRHAVTLLRQAKEATEQAYAASRSWQTDAAAAKKAPKCRAPAAAAAAASSQPAVAGSATLAAAPQLATTPAQAMARLLSAANTLLPEPAASQPADPVPDIDQSDPPATPGQLASWAKENLEALIQQADAAIAEWQPGTVMTEQQLRRLHGKARSAVSLWQQAIAAKRARRVLRPYAALVPLAEQATRALLELQDTYRVSHISAAERRRHHACEHARAAAAEQACRAVWRRALAAVADREHGVPTYQQTMDLKQEAESAKQLAWDIWGLAAAEQPMVIRMNDALDQAHHAAVTAHLNQLRDDALAVNGEWQHRHPTNWELAGLEAAHTAAQAMVAESPNPSVHTALSDEATAAVRAARRAKERADLEAERQAVFDKLLAVRDSARKDVARWRQKAPTAQERAELLSAINEVQNLIANNRDWCPMWLVWQVRDACDRVWSAAEDAFTAQAERRRVAEHALTGFTQRALLQRANWARKGRRSLPNQGVYLAMKCQAGELRERAREAFPDAYRHLSRRQYNPGAEPHHVPQDQAHAVGLINEFHGAWQLVKRIYKAWECVSAVPTAAVAA